MNSCLADLSHLIPSNYLKKGRGRIEKTEIVEMAIKHIKHLHELLPSSPTSGSQSNADDTNEDPRSRMGSNWKCPQEVESFKNGFNECMAEAVHCLVEKEHIPPENPLCSRLVTHLKRHLELKGHSGKKETSASSEHVAADSDYSSIRSESSAANSEVSSVVSATSGSASAVSAGGSGLSLQRNSLSSSRPSSSTSYVIAEGKRRSSDEMPSSGKFKFKDSIRERFSHEFESQTSMVVGEASIDHHSSTDHHHHGHEDFQAKRRRASRACDKEDDKNYVSQVLKKIYFCFLEPLFKVCFCRPSVQAKSIQQQRPRKRRKASQSLHYTQKGVITFPCRYPMMSYSPTYTSSSKEARCH